jgi:hypothetical protein
MVVQSRKDDFFLPSDEAVKASTLPRQSSKSIVLLAALFHSLDSRREKESEERRKHVLRERDVRKTSSGLSETHLALLV